MREDIINSIDKNKRIIEFGPLIRPIIKKDKFRNVFYADIKSTEDIKKLYTDNNYLESTGIEVNINEIVDIDIVIKDNYKKTFKNIEKFDVAILSHVIEHMPDIIHFFQDIKNVLKENGELIIIYPDKRYCFDHFRVETSFKDAFMTYKYGEKENDRMILDFCMNVMHENDPIFFWNNDNIVTKMNKEKSDKILEKFKNIKENNTFEDIHYWPFTDFGFLKFLSDLRRFNLLDFELIDFISTKKNTQEFMVRLKYTSEKKDDKLEYYINLLDQNVINYKNENMGEIIKLDTINNIKNEYNMVIDELNHKNEELIQCIEELKKDLNFKIIECEELKKVKEEKNEK